jgi:hypothetical protein
MNISTCVTITRNIPTDVVRDLYNNEHPSTLQKSKFVKVSLDEALRNPSIRVYVRIPFNSHSRLILHLFQNLHLT